MFLSEPGDLWTSPEKMDMKKAVISNWFSQTAHLLSTKSK